MIGTIDVRDLVGRPGSSKVEQLSGTLDDLETELAGLAEEASIRGELVLESLVEGILASGRVEGAFELRCARCLREFERGFSVDLHELFVLFPHEDSDEYPMDPEGFLEPEQMVRDVVGVELPFAPVCRADCRGLCARCGGDLNLGECTCREPRIDPRWEGLDALLDELRHDEAPIDDQAQVRTEEQAKEQAKEQAQEQAKEQEG